MNRRTAAPVLALLVMLSGWRGAAIVCGAGNWPCFRGPTGLGYTEEKNLPVTWGGKSGENIVWRSKLVGQGQASPIVWGDRLLVCTSCWPSGVAKPQEVIPDHHVLCYDARNGKLLWDTRVPPGPWLRIDFRSGPGAGYACTTPVTDGRHVYCAFGSSVVAALDFSGKIVWRREIIPYTFDTAMGSSPILYRDTLLVVCAMFVPEDSKTIAFDTKTGAVRWEKPLIATNDLGDGSHPSPAVAGGRLFLVGKENVFCVGKQ